MRSLSEARQEWEAIYAREDDLVRELMAVRQAKERVERELFNLGCVTQLAYGALGPMVLPPEEVRVGVAEIDGMSVLVLRQDDRWWCLHDGQFVPPGRPIYADWELYHMIYPLPTVVS